MIRGTVVEEKVVLDEAALAEVALQAKLEADALALAEAQAAAKIVFDQAIVLAKSEASTLTSTTAPIILAEVQKAQPKAPWLRAEVSNSKVRIENGIKELAAIPDATERANRKASIDNELKTLKDWQIAYPVDKVALRKADIRSALRFGYSQTDAEAWADDHDFLAKREASRGVL